jgi:hypothetical protein
MSAAAATIGCLAGLLFVTIVYVAMLRRRLARLAAELSQVSLQLDKARALWMAYAVRTSVERGLLRATTEHALDDGVREWISRR